MEDHSLRQENQPSTGHSTPSSSVSRRNILFGIVGVVMLLLVGSGTYYLGSQQHQSAKTTTSEQSSHSGIPTTVKITKSADMNSTSEFKYRFYNPHDVFFDKENYPTELSATEDSSLIPMSCTNNYAGY